jgi:hypothetical protein
MSKVHHRHERVLPPDDVTRRPPVLHERVARVGDIHRLKALVTVAGEAYLELVQSLEIEGDRSPRPVHLEGQVVEARDA